MKSAIQSAAAGRVHEVTQHVSATPGIEAMTLVSNHHFPRHSHSQFGFGLLHAGAQRSWSCAGMVEAVAGDVIAVNPGEMHDGAPLDGSARGWRMIYVDPAFLTREMHGEVCCPERLVVRPVVRDARLAGTFAQLFSTVRDRRPDLLACEERVLQFLLHLLRANSMTRPAISGPTPPVQKALERLRAAPAATVSLSELAALSGISRFQLLRGFAREVGITPHAFVLQLRVQLAQKLLAAGGGRSLVQTALEAGFADQSHMTRSFLRQTGVTPGRYRAAVM